jgi:hypothetical protein
VLFTTIIKDVRMVVLLVVLALLQLMDGFFWLIPTEKNYYF